MFDVFHSNAYQVNRFQRKKSLFIIVLKSSLKSDQNKSKILKQY